MRVTIFYLITICLFLSQTAVDAQHSSDYYRLRNYRDPAQFKKFHKRKKQVGKWQINSLKDGALVVRLKTREHLLNHLAAEPEIREKRRLEQKAINYNISVAFRQFYDFSKIYFIYSSDSDKLLKGVRKGIFLDSNLVRDSTIIMQETFYLIAEPDYYFSSSIGFVPESEAATQTERGSPVKKHQIVVKNRYGHQLNGPFPYTARGGGRAGIDLLEIDGKVFEFLPRSRTTPERDQGRSQKLTIPHSFCYSRYSKAVISFNERLCRYLLKAQLVTPLPDEETKKFFY